MGKPKPLNDYNSEEQNIVLKNLYELLIKHQDTTYATLIDYSKYSDDRSGKNIYFYVPELNKFFFLSTDYLCNYCNLDNSDKLVGNKILNYNEECIFSIDDLTDCRYGYISSFDNRTVIFPEVIELFKEKNKYSGFEEYNEKTKAKFNNNPFGRLLRYKHNDINIDFLMYAIVYVGHPQIEQLVKAGLYEMVYHWINDTSNLPLYSRSFKNGSNINEITKLPKFAWEMLRNEIAIVENISLWNEFRIWIQKSNLSKEELETILNLKIFDTKIIKDIRSILNTKYNEKKLYTLTSLLNYLSRVDMYQAIRSTDAILILKDYIKMAIECGVEPVTNSNSLKREHDVMMRNYQLVLEAKREEYKRSLGEPFKERSKELQKYEFKNNDLQVIVPKSMEDMIQEGNGNNNCVGSYIEMFAKGKSNIFFIRKNDNPSKSYITIEVNSDFSKVRQAYYSSNREITNEKDLSFINTWIDHIKNIYKESNYLSIDKDIVEDMF